MANQTAVIQQKRSVQDLINSAKVQDEIAKVLPKHMTRERMARVFLTTVLKTPELATCTPESLLAALMTCSQAGLEADGRLAHLIPFGNQVQVIFDYKGLVTLIKRNGAELVYAESVCEHDQFRAWVSDGTKHLEHEVNWRKDRGTPYLYYAVVKEKGTLDYEIMTMEQVEAIKDRSRAGKKGPWVTDFEEMAKKTTLRRISKRFDLAPEIREVIDKDDDRPDFTPPVSRPMFPAQVTSPPPKPKPEPEPPMDQGEGTDLGPQQPAAPETKAAETETEPTKQNPSYNPLKALRSLLKMAHVKESELLDYWASSGATDGSHGTLEEVAMANESLVRQTAENWKAVSDKMKELVP